MRVVRKGLSIDELGDLLVRPCIAMRYLGEKRAKVYVEGAGGGMVVIRLVPGRLRTWDFADDYALAGSLPEQ